MICMRASFNFHHPLHRPRGGGVGSDEMGSNLSKRRSASSGNLNRLPRQPDKYKLCGSLPNHLDVPPDNNNEREGGKGSGGRGAAPLNPLQPQATEDLGYGSERSPPYEPPLDPPFPACPVHHAQLIRNYPFINLGSIFTVEIRKGSGGLGLSVCGGDPWPGLVRIKRLFPHQPASHSGLLSPGDILLAASGVPLLGLTNYEALEVLRSGPSEVRLTVCRPPERALPPLDSANPAGPPPPPPRDPPLLRTQPNQTYGEFEISMEKVNGSLGFTLRKEDQSVLGHYVRALVREPALSDPRIRPGDKIVAVNDVEMSDLTHEEAVAFLRQCGSQVKLRLYRDAAQTPLPPHSPTHSHRTFKPILRKEAQDMLSELAIKKSQSPQDSSGSSTSKGSSPRKRRLTRTPPPSDSVDSLVSTEDDDRPRRPDNLVLGGDRKANYQFSPNTDIDVDLEPSGLEVSGPPPSEPVSMPPFPTPQPPQGFSYRNPAYRSANPPPTKPLVVEELPEGGCSEQDIPSMMDSDGGTKSLLKWKGVLFNSEEKSEVDSGRQEEDEAPKKQDSSSQCAPPAESPEYEVVIVELVRGWNSRLGFSLQNQEGASVISAIYPDSVASRDGRLRIGDKLINVNDENIDEMTTPDVIDLLRKIRGSICLTLLRKARPPASQ